jgi:hypothetical protein
MESGAGHRIDRRAVDPPQRLRFLDVVSRRDEGNGPATEHLIDQQIHQHRGLLSVHVDGADLSLCFGPDMPDLPGRAAHLHNGQDVISRLGDAAGVGDHSRLGSRRQRSPHHGHDSVRSTQHRCGLTHPGCALLSQGSGFVFGVAGLQRRLLRQVQCFDRGWWTAMILLEPDGQLSAAGLDVGAAGRPTLVQSGVDTDDLPDRPLRRIGRLAGSVPDRSANRTPKASRRCCSSAVL